MLAVLGTTIILALLGIFVPMLGMLSETTYGSKLEQYIASKNPKNTGDVERLQREYDTRQQRERFL